MTTVLQKFTNIHNMEDLPNVTGDFKNKNIIRNRSITKHK